MTFVKILAEVFPVFVEWFKWVVNIKDQEWEEITKAWPAPTKTRLAKLRAEAKAHDAFFGEDNNG